MVVLTPDAGGIALESFDSSHSLVFDALDNFHQLAYDGLVSKLKKCVTSDLEKADGYENYKKTKQSTKVKTLSGDERVKMLKYWLDHVGIVRHEFQIKFHDAMIKAGLKKIYEQEWATQYEQILAKYGIDKHIAELLIMCPRRYGKTFSVASFAACYLWCIPNCEIPIYAAGERAAKKLMILARSFLRHMPGYEEKIQYKNNQELVLDFGNGDIRKLCAYPCSTTVCL